MLGLKPTLTPSANLNLKTPLVLCPSYIPSVYVHFL